MATPPARRTPMAGRPATLWTRPGVQLPKPSGPIRTKIVFTSGATESNNLALRGVAERPRRRGNHLISVATEHKAVLDPLARLGRRGYEITILPVEQAGSARAGLFDPARLSETLRDDTLLTSVMWRTTKLA